MRWLVTLVFVACPLGAYAGPIATDRPGNGNAPTTVPSLRVQVEASASYLEGPTEEGKD